MVTARYGLNVMYKPAVATADLLELWEDAPDQNYEFNVRFRQRILARVDPLNDYWNNSHVFISGHFSYQETEDIEIPKFGATETEQRKAVDAADTHGFPIGLFSMNFENERDRATAISQIRGFGEVISIDETMTA
jgi:hypothetical protein